MKVILCTLTTVLAINSDAMANDIQAGQPQKEKNVLIIGASSLRSPLSELVDGMLESRQFPMNAEPAAFGAPELDRKWNSGKTWDYVIMDAWQFKRGATDAPGFEEAVTAFVKRVRVHSPHCKIILFTWWLPGGPDATKEGVMKVFQRCVDAARQHDIWVATTGPAFMEARLARPDLRVTVSKQDAHPGIHGAYINACSLFAILTGGSPVGLPATMKLPGSEKSNTASTASDQCHPLTSILADARSNPQKRRFSFSRRVSVASCHSALPTGLAFGVRTERVFLQTRVCR